MAQLLHTLHCPLGLALDLVVDLGQTQAAYLEGVEAGEYRSIVDIPNWERVMGDAPKPDFPLTRETITQLPIVLIRYVGDGLVIGDALDSFMESRHPN